MENGNDSTENIEQNVASAGMSPAELRRHISSTMGAPVEKNGADDSVPSDTRTEKEILAARAELAKSNRMFSVLQPHGSGEATDGLYVFLGSLIFGWYSRCTRDKGAGVTASLLTLPFINESASTALRNWVKSELYDNILPKIRVGLTATELKGVEVVFSLLRDGAQDFGSIMPNANAVALIKKEIESSTQVNSPLSRSWPMSIFSLYKEVLDEVVGEHDTEAAAAIHEVASGFAVYLTQLTRAISDVGFASSVSNSYTYDPTVFFKNVNILKAKTNSKERKPVPAGNDDSVTTVDQLRETNHKETLVNLFLNTHWMTRPFRTAQEGTTELSKMVRTFLSMQTGIATLPRTHDVGELAARGVYNKRIVTLHDRMGQLYHRYSGCLADYNATVGEESDVISIIKEALQFGQNLSADADDTVKAEAGAKIRAACVSIKEIVDGIADANICPAHIRSFKSQAVMAIMSYYVDFYSIMRSAIVTNGPIPELTKTDALGYISWMKGLSAAPSTRSANLFVEHTPGENFPDDAIQIGREFSLEDEDEDEVPADEDDEDEDDDIQSYLATREEREEMIDAAAEERLINPAFRLYLWDWEDAFDNIGEAYQYFMDAGVDDQYTARIAKMAEKYNCEYSLALEAHARARISNEKDLLSFYSRKVDEFDSVLDAVEAYDKSQRAKGSNTEPATTSTTTTTTTPAKTESDEETISPESYGSGLSEAQVDLIVKHHANAPQYYQVGWSAYWEEYESNLTKNSGKKSARKTRRKEEDVVGAAQYRKAYHRDPPNMFFRSYAKKTYGTGYTSYVTKAEPPKEPKPEEYTTYYFAYGSNMDEAQVQKRTPFAKLVGRFALLNHKLTFVTYNYSWKGGVANIEPSDGDVVYGLLWHFTDEMVTKMDRYEGHPHKYVRDEVTVNKLATDTSDQPATIKAIAYEIRSLVDQTDYQPASDKYYDQIKAAYEKFSLPVQVLADAQKFCTDNKVEHKGWDAGYSGTYYNGFESDDDYYDRWVSRGYQRGSVAKPYSGTSITQTTTTPGGATTATAGASAGAGGSLAESSIFHPHRWYLNMEAEWWSPANV